MEVRVVRVLEIDITASGPYVDLHAGAQRFTIRESMQNLSENLDPALFVRIHRSTIVRLTSSTRCFVMRAASTKCS